MLGKYLKKMVGASLTLDIEERADGTLKITIEEVDLDE